jgi:NAD(P)H-flavin reductase
MHKIILMKELSKDMFLMEIAAPHVARRCRPGQFVIIRSGERGERVPLTVAAADPGQGTITLIFQALGKSTRALAELSAGEEITDCVGPLGNPSEIEDFGTVVCIGGGTGIACVYPIIKALAAAGNEVISIIGARTASLLILEEEIADASRNLLVTTDDGSKGLRGLVTDALMQVISERGAKNIARVIAIGPPVMMKAVAGMTRDSGIKTIVSLNSIMLDGTGMCGSCRVFVAGEMKLACIDGPEFDAHSVNFDDLLSRLSMFRTKEKLAMEHYLAQKGTP